MQSSVPVPLSAACYTVARCGCGSSAQVFKNKRADKVGYLQCWIHLAAFQRLVFWNVFHCWEKKKKLNIKNPVRFLAPVVVFFGNLQLVTLGIMSCCWEWHTSRRRLEAGRKRRQRRFIRSGPPLLSMSVSFSNLFCSPSFSICLHLAPTGEGQSIDLLSLFPESGVKSAQGPPVLRPCSRIVSPRCWLLLPRQARERPCPSITRTSQEKSLGRAKAWETQRRRTMWLRLNSRRCGMFAAHTGLFFCHLWVFRWNCFSLSGEMSFWISFY